MKVCFAFKSVHVLNVKNEQGALPPFNFCVKYFLYISVKLLNDYLVVISSIMSAGELDKKTTKFNL